MAGKPSRASAKAEPAPVPDLLAIDRPYTLADSWWGRMLRDWPNKELVAYFSDPDQRYQEIAESRADQDVRDQFADILNASPLGRHHRHRAALDAAEPEAHHEASPAPDDTLTDLPVSPWDDTAVETEQWERFVADNPAPGLGGS